MKKSNKLTKKEYLDDGIEVDVGFAIDSLLSCRFASHYNYKIGDQLNYQTAAGKFSYGKEVPNECMGQVIESKFSVRFHPNVGYITWLVRDQIGTRSAFIHPYTLKKHSTKPEIKEWLSNYKPGDVVTINEYFAGLGTPMPKIVYREPLLDVPINLNLAIKGNDLDLQEHEVAERKELDELINKNIDRINAATIVLEEDDFVFDDVYVFRFGISSMLENDFI